MMELIKRNAESALRLIGDFLDLERVVGGKLELEITSNYIQLIMLEVKATFAHLARAKKIEIELAIFDHPIFAKCDHDRIVQVLSNLVSNAIKFTPVGGVISVDANFFASAKGNFVEISVSDTGPGIPDSEKKRIFDRYTQLANIDRRELGLGLYISKKLVEAHKGRLWVTSAVGSGSKFVISLSV
jgi:signal transduction histidine kinase